MAPLSSVQYHGPEARMANIVPEEIDAATRRGHAAREIETLELLEQRLPGEYTVYHGVHWARAGESASIYGEIDFIVVDRVGRAIAIEQKNGVVAIGSDDLVKQYASGAKGLRAQVTRNLNQLRSQFGQTHPGQRLDIDHLLYLPDHLVSGPLPSLIDRDRLVDARDRDRLAARIMEILENAVPPPSSAHGLRPADAIDIHQFLSELVDVAPSVDAASRLARTHFRRLSGGLATWARQLELAPHRLRVIGTAGSGKTQLALEELRTAKAADQTALYVCFNRPLADAMRAVAPDPESCMTFHELGAWMIRQRGEAIDWSAPGVFDRIAQALIDAAPEMRESIDLLVIDEGQDFEANWAQALLQLVKPNGRAFWLEDPSQNLYRREPMPLPGWAVLRSPINYRSPHILVTLANALELTEQPQKAGGAIHGFDPVLLQYADTDELVGQTSAAVSDLIKQGHAPSDIAVLTWRGMNHSEIIGLDTLAGQRTRRFTGRYTEGGQAIVTDGELTLDTLFRFKGQAADCVVLTEIDFDEWNEDVRRRLFVGLSRARLTLVLVASEDAERMICERLS